LGLCNWDFWLEFNTLGTSFTGNATANWLFQDFPSYGYTTPFWTFSGSGGVDSLTIVDVGVYLLVFVINCSSSSIYTVNIVPHCSLTGITVISSSENFDIPSISRVTSYAIISNSYGGVISFPNSASLVTLYGANWSTSALSQMYIVRLS